MKLRLHAFGIGVTILALTVSVATLAVAKEHTVQKGDTLWRIAKQNGVTVDAIERANDIDANKPLQIGAKLTIPSEDESQTASEAEAVRQQRNENRFGPRVARQIEETEEAVKAAGGDTATPAIVRTALAYRGARYVRGGTGARGFDCSGFTQFVYKKHGASLPHSSKAQASCGVSVSRSELQPGDLVFFQTNSRGISHVGMYIGNDKFIHASTPKRGVITSSLSEKYYSTRYKGARRITSVK